MNKYNATRTLYAGQWYDSAGEAWYAQQLDAQRAAGRIREWRRGREWTLLESPTGKKRDGIYLRVDFEVVGADGRLRAVDFKGVLTRDFKLKARMWRAVYPTVPLFVVKRDGAEVAA